MKNMMCLGAVCFMVGCGGEGGGSRPHIFDGNTIKDSEYPATVMVMNPGCTGTFIAANLVLTAGHCLTEPGMPMIVAGGKKLAAKAKFVHPDYKPEDPASEYMEWEMIHNDVGLIVTSVSSNYKASLCAEGVKSQDSVTLVGYGDDDLVWETGFGTRRLGTNKVKDVEDGVITFRGAQHLTGKPGNAMIGGGDSGGPLYKGACLVGSTSGSSTHAGSYEAYYVDLSQKTIRDFLALHGG